MKNFLSILIFLFLSINSVYAEEIYKTKLKNGQTLIVKEVKNNPMVIIDTWVKTGSIDEDDKNNGVAHFLEHLFFKGSKNYPANRFDKIIESKGASTNAATSKDFTHYYILIPSKDFETAVKLHSDMLLNPLLPQNEIDKERLVVIREIEKNNDNPQRKVYKQFNKELYKCHPYKREVIGTKEIIKNISRDEILNFYNAHYTPDNFITVVVGDIDAKKAQEIVEKNFVTCKKIQKSVKNSYKKDKSSCIQKTVTSKEDISLTYMLIGYKTGLKVTQKDSYALDLLSVILGSGVSSRLYKDLYDNKQIVHNIGSVHSSYKEDSIFLISADLDEQNIEKAKQEIFNQIKKVKEQGISKEELNKAKKMLERQTLYSRESIQNTATEIGYSTLITDDWNFYSKYLENMKKVTIKDVKQVARKYLNENQAVISIISPKVPQQKMKTIENDGTTDVKTEIDSENYFKPKFSKPVKEVLCGKLKKVTLKNGATLIFDKHKNNEIMAINIKVKGGNLIDKKQGVSVITASVMNLGTKKYPKSVYAKITEENGINISPSSDIEWFSVNTKCTKLDLPLALDILNEVLNNAILDKTEIEKTKREILYTIKSSRDDSTSLALEKLNTELWNNSPFYVSPDVIEKNLPNITQEDVKNCYENLFVPENIVVTINGNFDEKEMINYFSQVFNSKNKNIVDYKNYANIVKPINQNKTITTYKGEESAWIFFGWLTDGVINQKDRITLRVINSILGSGMSSRLFSEVRAEKGLAYAVASTTVANSTNGAFYIYIGTDPNKVNDAKISILQEVEKLKTEFVTEKELQDAKNKLKGRAILGQETNSQKAETISISEINGNGCDFYFDKFNKMVDEVTVSDIITVANKYFSKPYIVSEVLPKK